MTVFKKIKYKKINLKAFYLKNLIKILVTKYYIANTVGPEKPGAEIKINIPSLEARTVEGIKSSILQK